MKNTYKVIVTEILEREVYISAEDEYDAIDKVETDYNNCDIILNTEDHIETSIKCGRFTHRVK